ncbi:MAG TPA: hypothetical protein VFE70_03415, partial [Candidatus Elarobacter sp.]|nr:hypothetical protein [Candidatus Elarobacter sp.]
MSEKLPRGAAGGHLFAKAIDLLLVNEARLSSQVATVFDDRAGDYFGLDSFVSGFRRVSTIGYQYKFYSSPLTSAHKRDIIDSIEAI